MAKAYVTITERLLLTSEGQAVPAGDPRGVRLFATPGKRISIEEAKRHGVGRDGDPKPIRKRRFFGAPSDKAYHGRT